MKKLFGILLVFVILLLCSSCIDPYPMNLEGVVESKVPCIRIDLSSDTDLYQNMNGELVQDDGTIIKISFAAGQGRFFIFKYREDGEYGIDDNDILYSGKYRVRGDNLVLYPDDGEKIILEQVDAQ